MTPKIHNKYEIMVTDTKTGNKKHYVTHNTVTENYKTRLIGSNVTNHINILFGEGSTLPTPQDTEIVDYLGASSFTANFEESGYSFDDTTNTVTLSRTTSIGTTSYVGKIFSEIGLGASSTNIISRALFADSEGQPMPIGPKTNTEIYDITATIYMQLPVMDGFSYRKGHDFMNYALNLLRGAIGISNLYSYDLQLGLTLSSFGDKKILKTSRMSQNISNGDLGVNGFPKMFVSGSGILQKFPNLNFEPVTFDNQQIGTGDGSSRRFGLSTPFFDDGTLQVMVNGIIVPHTILNKCERFPLAYSGLDDLYGREVRWYKTDSKYENPVEIYWDNGVEYNYNLGNYGYYLLDLGAEIELTHLSTGRISSIAYMNEQKEFVSLPSATEISNDFYKLNTPIVTRYIRFYTYIYSPFGDFYSQHNIQLDTAPQLGDVVTASWQTSVPPKNENLEYEFTYTFDV